MIFFSSTKLCECAFIGNIKSNSFKPTPHELKFKHGITKIYSFVLTFHIYKCHHKSEHYFKIWNDNKFSLHKRAQHGDWMKPIINKGGQFEQFHNMCVKYTPPKCVAFNFGFYILIFTNLMLYNLWEINLKY
jgi:hypothetical protein